MEILAAVTLTAILGKVQSILFVALGLGLVIFFHELGHFAVAKWCDVNVERFSIGFGPILWSRKWGETEYALSAIPFGGYVKMLGQDDMDPSQLSSEEIAEDPRSYSSKSVPQRMAIISAGVIMNVATAVLFFALAFGMGVLKNPATVGFVQPGMPAWTAGIEQGDVITRINGNEVTAFSDITRGVALTSGDVVVEGVRPDGSTFKRTLVPDRRGTRRIIGVGPASGLTFGKPLEENVPPAEAGTPAAKADPPFEPGDRIVRVDDAEVSTYFELENVLARRRSEPLDVYVAREGQSEPVRITVAPRPLRTLGLWMDIGRITAVKRDSSAANAKPNPLRVGDRITHVQVGDESPLAVGNDVDPLDLPDFFAEHHGKSLKITVKRHVEGDESNVETVSLVPEDRPGWIEEPNAEDVPLSVPAIGIAFYLTPTVIHVVPGSPADQAGITKGERIEQMTLVRPDGAAADGFKEANFEIKFGGKDDEGNEINRNAAYAAWALQKAPTRNVVLKVAGSGGARDVGLTPADESDEWFPYRGMGLEYDTVELKADGLVASMQLGLTHTRNSISDIYLTLRNLFGGDLSVKELHGPVGIAQVAYKVAERGIPDLLLFLGFLSVNLAVLNFLPIPVLDGGHMVFLIWEGVTRKRPSERVLVAATYFGMMFVLGLMALVLYLDIFVHRGNI